MPTLRDIFRHPVKSLGEEALGSVALTAVRPLPWDRAWAILHGGSAREPATGSWRSRQNFVVQAMVAELARVVVAFDADTRRLSLAHPVAGHAEIEDPDSEAGARALTRWIAPLASATQPGPYRVARARDGALTDEPDGHVLICSTASRAALEEMAGQPLAPIRFRANLWLDGLDPWEELGWIGGEIAVGEARLRIIRRCERCNATAASPETGARDVQVPALLRRRLGHMDFGVYAQVTTGGVVRTGDPVRR